MHCCNPTHFFLFLNLTEIFSPLQLPSVQIQLASCLPQSSLYFQWWQFLFYSKIMFCRPMIAPTFALSNSSNSFLNANSHIKTQLSRQSIRGVEQNSHQCWRPCSCLTSRMVPVFPPTNLAVWTSFCAPDHPWPWDGFLHAGIPYLISGQLIFPLCWNHDTRHPLLLTWA